MTESQGPRLGRNMVMFAGLVGGVAVVLAAIVIGVAVTRSGSDDVPPTVAPPATEAPMTTSTDVTLSIDGTVAGNRLNVRGTATVPNGAYVLYEITGPEGCTNCTAAGRVNVQEEEFAVSLDVSAWGEGEIHMKAMFQMDIPEAGQPPHVVELYGEDGSRISGDTVVVDGVTRVEVEDTVSFDGEIE